MIRRRSALYALLVILLLTACDRPAPTEDAPGDEPSEHLPDKPAELETASTTASHRGGERAQMVTEQIEERGITDERVLEAIRKVPRHLYVPESLRAHAYSDRPLPIGLEQTISQPYIVALMSELLQVSPGDRVLEIGTGSGYQAAVLAEMGAKVFTIEILCELAERAKEDLAATGYDTVEVRCGDGYQGWPEHAPFDRIIVTAAPPELPDALVDQLATGGLLVVPVGERLQTLQVVEKIDEDSIETTDTIAVRFVPMVHGD